MNTSPAVSASRPRAPRAVIPVGMLVLVLLPLLLLPLAAVFVFAFRGGMGAFIAALTTPVHAASAQIGGLVKRARDKVVEQQVDLARAGARPLRVGMAFTRRRLLASAGAGGRPVTSRISRSSSVRARALPTTCNRCSRSVHHQPVARGRPARVAAARSDDSTPGRCRRAGARRSLHAISGH